VGLDRTWVTLTSQAKVTTLLFSKLFFSKKISSQWDGHQTSLTTVFKCHFISSIYFKLY
jgi:hypothetical protein